MDNTSRQDRHDAARFKQNLAKSRGAWLYHEKKVNAIVRERADGRCEKCGNIGSRLRPLGVHEIDAKGMGGTLYLYSPEEKLLLCGRCHAAEQLGRDYEKSGG